MTNSPQLEIAITSLQDALSAQWGGADSIEVSQDLQRDGLTPPLELIQAIRDALTIDVHVIIRPHDRDFIYTPAEVDLILEQTRTISQMGITGLVFGAQQADGRIDVPLIQQVVQAANGLPVTLHRALDRSVEPEKALQTLIGIVPRVLTSGPAANAWAGRDGLRDWVQQFGEHFSFVAAGSLKADQLATYKSYVHAHEYHFGSGARTGENVDPAKVENLREILEGNP